MANTIKVAVSGACGRMGGEVVRTVLGDSETVFVGACDLYGAGKKIGDVISADSDVTVEADFKKMIDSCGADVLVDFAKPFNFDNIKYAIEKGVVPVIGTTGQTEEQLKELDELAKAKGTSCAVIPNFAIGAVLMMKCAAEAAKYMPEVEIIELHHDKKIDSPSGTAIKTAKGIADARKAAGVAAEKPLGNPSDSARGYSEVDGIHIHSVRLPGLVAHQEVLLGGKGQLLTIKHDSMDRTSFMPGVLLAVKNIKNKTGLVYGLDKLM